METVQNLLIQSNTQSILKWSEEVKQQVTGLDELFYENGRFTPKVTGCLVEKASLIVMGREFNCAQLQCLLQLLNNENVAAIRLHAPEVIENVTVMRFVLNDNPQLLKAKIDLFCKENQIDFALMTRFPDWSKPGLVLMDMDSTTIQIECIDEIARLYGVGDQVAAV
ncbi:MAG: phosphoserine phosphatase SerB, partial [Psychromonas sp.]|nr:phosphoserine phosphatase SerB [Psychromonas sp.]